MTPEVKEMIRGWMKFCGNDTEKVAKYLARTLRIGRLPECRKIVIEAMQD